MNWWLPHRRLKIPDRISFTTENNPFGYDWFWGVCDNDWSIFYGNSLFWISEGPSFGLLTIFKEDGTYLDFADVNFLYNKTRYIEKYDIYYPVDMTVSARLDDKYLKLRVRPVCKEIEYIDEFKGDGFYRAFIMPEMPGRMEGFYRDKNKEIKLQGDCKIVQQRQPSKLGHNKLTFDFLKPPKGFGLSVNLDSHYLKKNIFAKLHLLPKPSMNLKVKNTGK